MTQNNSPISSVTEGYRHIIKTETDSQNRINGFEKTNIRLSQFARPYPFNVRVDDGPHDLALFFGKVAYHVNIAMVVTLNDLLAVENIHGNVAGSNSIRKDFVLQAWMESPKVDRLATTANGKPRVAEHRKYRGIASSHWRPTRTPLV